MVARGRGACVVAQGVGACVVAPGGGWGMGGIQRDTEIRSMSGGTHPTGMHSC